MASPNELLHHAVTKTGLHDFGDDSFREGFEILVRALNCWQSALFPSCRGCGYIAYPPRPDGAPAFNEGYVFSGDGVLIPARVVEAPWLRRIHPLGEDVSLVLETADGTVRIAGETVLSTHDITDPSELPAEMLELMANWSFPALQQAGVRYTWDGEQSIGMLERSIPKDQLARD